MVSNACDPKTQHAPKRNQNAEEVGHHEHSLRFKLEIFLDIPETEC